MPKRRESAPGRPTPIQLPLFAETASLVRVRPTLNEWRYYRMEIWPDLFGRALLVRQWGRIGTEGRRRIDPHPDAGAAINALADILRANGRLIETKGTHAFNRWIKTNLQRNTPLDQFVRELLTATELGQPESDLEPGSRAPALGLHAAELSGDHGAHHADELVGLAVRCTQGVNR